MNLRRVNIAFLLLSMLILGSCKTKEESVKLTNSKPKNILFIAVDDLKPLLNVYGENQMHTPNIDRLAKMGTIFTNAHVQQAVCGPSRASVMTGMYPDNTKVWDLDTNFRESAPELMSMPEYLITQGYETSATGKIYHDNSTSSGHDAKSWSIPHSNPNYFDKKYGPPAYGTYQNPNTKRLIKIYEEEAKEKGFNNKQQRKYVDKRIRPSTECVDVSDEAYRSGLFPIEGVRKMDKMLETGKPFFLGIGFRKPHLAFVAPKKYWDLYKREDIKLSEPQKLSKGTPDIAYHSFGELRGYSDIDNNFGVGDVFPEAKQRELIHGYMACISYIDAQIGKLLDALEERNILDETVIVLWGDHGYHLGDHTLWNKHSNFEQATRIPFMFAGPSVAKNIKVDKPVELLDLFPTLFDLAGVKSLELDGKSLKPLLDTDPNTNINPKYAISQYRRHKSKMGYSIRTKRYRYTEWHDEGYRSFTPYKEERILGRELYDYEVDPLETKNLINDASYADTAKLLKAELKSFLTK
ncbi:Arylsulfatase A [Lutibacter agarilyticus]|uniref:Arylsulfatase A n=1 Tax=Lutibacter agarilyticus TaxID=1109740 RepID=A0A238Z5B0_9FLAO|nr:sulfatase [Lutibacter agarilyticus]SNR78014.1 Arylsulfatase A [Lutibacter agarilyticus]